MPASTVREKLLNQMDALSVDEQRQVLRFARALVEAHPTGTPGDRLLRFAGTISPGDLSTMSKAVEEGCGRVDPDGW